MLHPTVVSRVLWAAAATLAFCLVVYCYAPGLKGNFLFDDFANLPTLGATGPVDDIPSFLRYITSGKADPTGRPLSMLSFLIDAHDWPADPYPFKRTNLILHLINAALLVALLDRLGKAFELDREKARWAALIGAVWWAAHPFFVSTVLYVVQREAMLCGTFTLLALFCWLYGRSRYATSPAQGFSWVVLGTVTCTVLATLSKANGLLIPVLILVLQATLPSTRAERPFSFERLSLTLFGPMAALIVGYVLWMGIASIGHGPISIRGWSVGQRLMTEPGILLEYLAQLWLIKPTDSSLLHDNHAVATGLFSTWHTAASIVICLGAIVAAWVGRRRKPLLAFAILFFAAGHLMESTSLALELYFDHRNYIPAMPMFWPLAVALMQWRARAAARIVVVAVTLTLAGLTYANALLWGKPLEQAVSWAQAHPDSARAQAYGADMQASHGHVSQALETIEMAATHFRAEPQIAFNLVDLHCETGRLQPSDVKYTSTALRTAQREPGALLSRWIENTIDLTQNGRCPGLERSDLVAFLDAAMANPKIAAVRGRRQDIDHLRGAIALAYKEGDVAASWFDQALAQDPTPQAALGQAAALGRAGYPSLGLRHLEYFGTLPRAKSPRWVDGMPWLHAEVLARQGYWEGELDHLRASLAASIKESGH